MYIFSDSVYILICLFVLPYYERYDVINNSLTCYVNARISGNMSMLCIVFQTLVYIHVERLCIGLYGVTIVPIHVHVLNCDLW